MLRSAFATFLGAAFGAVAIVPMRERIADQLLQAPEAYSVLAVAILAGLLALLIMACREPVEHCRCGGRGGAQGLDCLGNPIPSTLGPISKPARDRAGRFVSP